MNGFHKEKRTLTERGLHEHTYFTAHFEDGSTRSEHDLNWSDVSELIQVLYFGGVKTVMANTHPIKKLNIKHNNLETEIEVPKGCRVYQAVRAQTTFFGNENNSSIIGRVVGLVKDGVVIEERFVDGRLGIVQGMKL